MQEIPELGIAMARLLIQQLRWQPTLPRPWLNAVRLA